jgi:hypothetical protein
VLLHKAEIPSADALPKSLQPLTRRHAVMLTQHRFKADAQGLITEVEKALAEVEQARQEQGETNARRVLIIRPFGVKEDRLGNRIDFDLVQKRLVEPALSTCGLESGKQLDVSALGLRGRQDILPVLMKAKLAIADISIDNANVFYQLGMRLASGDKNTILLQSINRSAAFDVLGERYLMYHPQNPEASVMALTKTIRQTLYPLGEIQ